MFAGVKLGEGSVRLVQPQAAFALVRAMAGKAPTRQDRLDITAELDLSDCRRLAGRYRKLLSLEMGRRRNQH